jgi:hypothetical protein
MTLGHDTFGINKTEFSEKLSRIIKNFRANSKLIGEPKDFVLRCCRLTEKWEKLANDSETLVYLRNIDIASGRKIKMIVLQRGNTQQPVPKAQLISALYPTRKMATSASPEEKHFNAVRASMRFAVTYQLRAFRDSCHLPIICHITGKKIIPGARADVDHVGKTFSELCDDFIRLKELKYTDIILKGPPTAKIFKDKALWESWVYYHLEHARFALTLASANRSKGCGDYKTDLTLIGSFAKETPEDLALDF